MNKNSSNEKSKTNNESSTADKKPGKPATYGNEPAIREPAKPAQPSEYEVDKNEP